MINGRLSPCSTSVFASENRQPRDGDKQPEDDFYGLVFMQSFSVLQFPLDQDWFFCSLI